MHLPGGLACGRKRLRDAAFRPLDGHTELALAEGALSGASVPLRVTGALAAALDHIGGQPVTAEIARDLCVGDRQFLMRQLAVRMGTDRMWLTARCHCCGEAMDLCVENSTLPVKPAGRGYPFARVSAGRRAWRFRVPTGRDQEAIADIADPAEAADELLRRCWAPTKSGPASPPRFSPDAMARIEAAMDDVAPQVATEAATTCPACGEALGVPVDPYALLLLGERSFFSEVHTLASAYHWSEGEILAMPRARRQVYLKLIDEARGMAH